MYQLNRGLEFRCKFLMLYYLLIFKLTLGKFTGNRNIQSSNSRVFCRRVVKWGRGEDSPPCTTYLRPVFPKQKTCLLCCYALNCRPEEFFISSFLRRKTVWQYSFWFQKVPLLAAQEFKELMQRRRSAPKSRCHRPILVFPVTLLGKFPKRM